MSEAARSPMEPSTFSGATFSRVRGVNHPIDRSKNNRAFTKPVRCKRLELRGRVFSKASYSNPLYRWPLACEASSSEGYRG